ncbi:MAG: sulfur carrier protein ThiS [Candidatus Aquicultorales bacterium]
MPAITINGEKRTYEEGTTVWEVLESLNLRPEVVAVELNGSLLRKEDYREAVSDGDLLEYLYYMAGGEASGEETTTRRVRFSFPLTRVKDPVIYKLVKEFDLVPNIRRANIEAERGWVVLEISGTKANIERGFDFVRSFGVDVEPVEGDLIEG